MAHCPPPRPARCPSNRNPPRSTCLGHTLAPPHGTPPRLAQRWTRTRWPCPPHTPRPPQQRGAGPFDDAELRALYGIRASKPSSELVATFRGHLRDVDPNRLYAVVPLPHAATTVIFVRQLQALVTPEHRSKTTWLKRRSGGSTPTNQPRGACGSDTWAECTRS